MSPHIRRPGKGAHSVYAMRSRSPLTTLAMASSIDGTRLRFLLIQRRRLKPFTCNKGAVARDDREPHAAHRPDTATGELDSQLSCLDLPEDPAVPAKRRGLAAHAAVDHHRPSLHASVKVSARHLRRVAPGRSTKCPVRA